MGRYGMSSPTSAACSSRRCWRVMLRGRKSARWPRRTLEEFEALAQGPAPEEPPNATETGGEPVDEATRADIAATARELVACSNAGDILRRLALYSDDRLRFAYPDGPTRALEMIAESPLPLSLAERVALVDVDDVRRLEDGRVGARVTVDNPASHSHDPQAAAAASQQEVARLIFVQEAGRWRVDETRREDMQTNATPIARAKRPLSNARATREERRISGRAQRKVAAEQAARRKRLTMVGGAIAAALIVALVAIPRNRPREAGPPVLAADAHVRGNPGRRHGDGSGGRPGHRRRVGRLHLTRLPRVHPCGETPARLRVRCSPAPSASSIVTTRSVVLKRSAPPKPPPAPPIKAPTGGITTRCS